MVDSDGYGARQGQTPIERLIEDCRTLSPAGIERIAAGWDANHQHEAFHSAEKAALHTIESQGKSTDWDALRNQLLGLTERGTPLVRYRTGDLAQIKRGACACGRSSARAEGGVRGRLSERLRPDRLGGFDQPGEPGAAGQRLRRNIGEDRAGIVAPGDGVRCQVPEEGRLA